MSSMKITAGGLTQMWFGLAERLRPLYDGYLQEVRGSPVVQADETGWRISGRTAWLWCFTTAKTVYYLISPSRCANVALGVLGECFNGTLVSDFFCAYNKVKAGYKQKCLVHLLRDLKTTSKKNQTSEWKAFAKKLKRLLKDAIKLSKNRDLLSLMDFKRLTAKIRERHEKIIENEYTEKDVNRLRKRLKRHKDEMYIFLDNPLVPFDNNESERNIRPLVIARKNSYCNRSEKGSEAQAILASIFKTISLRKNDPVEFVIDYLRNDLNHNNFQRTNKLAA